MTGATYDGATQWQGRLLGIVAATLVVFGVAAVYGASSIVAVQRGDPGSWFAMRQLQGAMIGVVLLLVGARVDYHVWQRVAWPLLGATALILLLLLMPFAHPIAPELNGARRWLQLGPFGFQPSETAKFAVIAWTAMLATKKGDDLRHLRRGMLPFLVVLVPLSAFIVFEPDLSTGALVLLLAGVVLFTAGARIGHFLLLGVAALPIAWHEIVSVQYRLARMVSFLSRGDETADASWQITQSLIGIGAGRFVGTGFGEGLQKLGYLPYAYSDFIFSTIGEEWGFVGVTVILLLYAAYAALGLHIARTAPDRFGMLLAAGLTATVAVTALLHVAVTLDLVPTTGLPLPFISYGRTSLLVSLLATGVLINIADSRGLPRAGR